MMINVLTLSAEQGATNNFSQAGIVSLMGMVTIFMVLALLWLAIEVMHVLLHREKKEKKVPEALTPAPTAPAVTAAEETAMAADLAQGEDEGAIVAAITAAITAMRADEGQTGAFRVVSFKRAARGSSRRGA